MPTLDQPTESARIDANRICWRSRRGLLELDLLLSPFARDRYPTLPPALKAAYAALLERDDQEIWAWLQGGEGLPDPMLDTLRGLIRDVGVGRGR